MTKNKILNAYITALVLLVFSVILGVMFGASSIGFDDVMDAFFKREMDTPEGKILWYVRFPRVLASMLCGGALAVSGAVIQNVLANPLASPSIIGVNSGAGLAVTVCSALGIYGGWRLSLFAFLGAFASVMLISLGAQKWGQSKGTVILIGVALNSLLGAFSDSIITVTPDVGIMSSDFRVGDFSAVSYTRLIPAAVVIFVSLLVLCSISNELDVLTLGDENAKGLGLNTSLMRCIFLMISALLAGSAVSICGLLSFVGLLVPHAVRRAAGGQAKHLLLLCALFGAGFVSLCDTLARVIFAPYEIPVGIIMAFLGAPFFLFVLIKRKGEESYG